MSTRKRQDLASRRAAEDLTPHATLDTLGLYCPLPIIRTSERIASMGPREILEVVSDDRVILEDMPAWCLSTGHEYLGYREGAREWRLFVRRN